MPRRHSIVLLLGALASCKAESSLPAAVPSAISGEPSPAGSANPPVSIPLPGARGPAFLDYLAYDAKGDRVWVPVGNTGSVDVLDISRRAFVRIDGFKTAAREVKGRQRILGPSAATVGEGFVYIGDRASSEVCPVDAASLSVAPCLVLPSPTDGVSYVAATKEVWVTTPHDQSLTILDASSGGTLRLKGEVKAGGETEGYAVDEGRGLFFTNLEDKDRTLVIDVNTRQIKATWKPGCGDAGPRGLAIDPGRGYLFVACTDHVQVLDEGHDGAPLGKLDTGAGLDNLDYLAPEKLLYAAAGKAEVLIVARADDAGQLTTVSSRHTAAGARNAVADSHGNAYVADPSSATLLVFSHSQ